MANVLVRVNSINVSALSVDEKSSLSLRPIVDAGTPADIDLVVGTLHKPEILKPNNGIVTLFDECHIFQTYGLLTSVGSNRYDYIPKHINPNINLEIADRVILHEGHCRNCIKNGRIMDDVIEVLCSNCAINCSTPSLNRIFVF
jgi:hypothetical protein